MIYFRCKNYPQCGNDTCQKCPTWTEELMRELGEAITDHLKVLPAAPTANEIFVAIQKQKRKRR